MLHVRQAHEAGGKCFLFPDFIGLHLRKFVPGQAVLEQHGGSDWLRLPFGHAHPGMCFAVKSVAVVQQLGLFGHDLGLFFLILSHGLLSEASGGLTGRSAEEIIRKIDAIEAFFFRLLNRRIDRLPGFASLPIGVDVRSGYREKNPQECHIHCRL